VIFLISVNDNDFFSFKDLVDLNRLVLDDNDDSSKINALVVMIIPQHIPIPPVIPNSSLPISGVLLSSYNKGKMFSRAKRKKKHIKIKMIRKTNKK